MRNLLLVVLLSAVMSPAYSAQLLLSSEPTPGQLGIDGFHTFTLSLQTEGSETFRGVDAHFAGAMNQVYPGGSPSIFTDTWSWWWPLGEDPLTDSCFLFNTSNILQIGGQEGPTLLKAAISGLADNGLSNPAPFAQIVAKNGAVNYNLAFDVGLPDPVRFVSVTPLTTIPEPTTCVLAGLALVGAAARRRV